MMSREFFKIETDWPDGSAAIIIKEENRSPLRYGDIYKGECEADFLRGFQLTKFTPGKLLDILPNNLGWPIASPRCCECFLSSANDDVQFLPIKPLLLQPSFPEELAAYCLLNARTVLDCLDLSSPEIRWFDETRQHVRSYRKLPLRLSLIPDGVDFFCVKRFAAIHIVSAELKDALSHAGDTGWAYMRCDTSAS